MPDKDKTPEGQLNQRQRLFALLYALTGDASLSASAAGYRSRRTTWRLQRHPGVQEEVQRCLDRDHQILSATEILRELSRVACDTEHTVSVRVRSLELLGRRLGLWEAWQHRKGIPPQVLDADELSIYGAFLETLTTPTPASDDS